MGSGQVSSSRKPASFQGQGSHPVSQCHSFAYLCGIYSSLSNGYHGDLDERPTPLLEHKCLKGRGVQTSVLTLFAELN